MNASRLPSNDRLNAENAVIEKVSALGIGISAVNREKAADMLMSWLKNRACQTATFAAVHSIVDAQQEPLAKLAMQQSGICAPDGVPLVWLLKLSGKKNVSRVFGPDLMLDVSKRMAEEGYSAFYYGGTQEAVTDLALQMERRFPGIRTAGTYSPPFRELTDTEETEVVDMINGAQADIVWVGLGSPKQERWINRFRDRLDAPVIAAVGAAFDYNTNRLKRAPRWMQICGLEWLFRLLQEPRRLWRRYLRNNPLFIFLLFCEKTGLRNFR